MIGALLLCAAFYDVRITAASNDAARELARERLSVYRVDGRDAYAVAPDETIARLRARGLAVVTLAESPARDAGYRSAAEVNDALTALAMAHADIARLERLGTSRNGVALFGLRVGDPSLPAVRILGGHHGDEAPGVEVPLQWLEGFLAARATDPAVNARLQRTSLLVAPLVNPDGYTAHTRYNAANIDLNRNYGFAYRDDEFAAGPRAFSEPEVRAVALDNEHHRYGLSLTFHTGALNIGYPFNYTTDPGASDARFSTYGNAYKAQITAPQFYVTRGALWFVSYGDCNDYSLGYFGGADFTVEMSTTKTPPPSMLAALVQEHGAAITRWLAFSDETTRVVVRDAATHEPLPATVVSDDVTAVCDPLRGTTQLQTTAGATLHVSAPGYQGIDVTAAHAEPIVVELEPLGLGDRVQVIAGFAGAADQPIELGLQTKQLLQSVRGVRPGAEDVAFDCDMKTLRCSAEKRHRRPGFYALIATLSNGGEILTPNAFYLADEAAADPPVGPDSPFAVDPVHVTHGSGNGEDVVYRYDGVLYRSAIATDPAETADLAQREPVKKTGCSASGGGAFFFFALIVACERWRRTSRSTTRTTR